MKKSFLLLGLASTILVSACSPLDTEEDIQESSTFETINTVYETEILDDGIMITDGVKHSVELEDILSGGPPKDGIPSIDDPEFITVEEANEFLDDEGIGVSVQIGDTVRFYPFQILVWHEIVNDTIEGEAALITYCPLCGSGIVFDPIVNGDVSEFGTSGKLWNSNLVMYDRQTDSYWSQILGEAIVGEMTGSKLDLLPHQNMQWKTWKEQFPNGEVLSDDTGYFRDYTSGGPYGDYDTNSSVIFPVDYSDGTYHPKAVLYGLEVDGQSKAYLVEELIKVEGEFTDTIGETELSISYNQETQAFTAIDSNTSEEVLPFFSFWFSWIAVHPESDVFTVE